ncbi:DZF family protein [Aphelenchoides avenae]|nr:DZF family protein [Aphelenchus avenae]
MAQFYCEVCKVSCAGQQTYDEHLQGQKHKKKAAIEKGENQQSLPRSKVSFKCDVCNVTCTGRDTYEAHVKGTKHQKTMSLLRKLGKPIPAMEPTLIPPLDASSGAPIPTVGGDAVPAKAASTDRSDTSSLVEKALLEEENIEIVGEEYIVDERDAAGKFIQYNCKLCDCKFSDPNAKAIHLKGRRHRLQFKNKVDPKFRVEVKSNNPRKRRDLMQQEMEFMGHPM